MTMCRRTFVVFLLLSLSGCALCELHHINRLVDSVLSSLRAKFQPSLELDELAVPVAPDGNSFISCTSGNATSLASLSRHGYARQLENSYYYNTYDVWSYLSLEPFSFTFADCFIRNSTDYRPVGKLSGSSRFSTGYLRLSAKLKDGKVNCTTSFSEFGLLSLTVDFDNGTVDPALEKEVSLKDLLYSVENNIINSVNLTLTEYTDVTYESTEPC